MRMTRRCAIGRLALVTGAGMLGGCMVNPVTGRRELMLMSEQQEIALGKQSHPEICASYGVYPDKSLQEWFGKKGRELALVTQRSGLPFTFTVLDSPVVNAFAVPGGYVYVTRGIMGYFNDEAQFAGVLAHELGHIAARHSARQYSKIQLANLAIGVGSALSEEFSRYSSLVSVGTTLMFLKFSRDDERQADRLGVEYSSKCSYDAVRMSDFFGTLERLAPGGGSLPGWASTHPDPGDRIAATRRLALDWQKAHPDVTYTARRDEYFEKVDGLTFGEDPRQGYVKDGMFIHPQLKFAFPVPGGWTLTNQPNEVRMAPSKSEDVVFVLRVSQGKNLSEASSGFQSANKVEVKESSPITVNGMNGLVTTGALAVEGGTAPIRSWYILMEDRVFMFHGLASSSAFDAAAQEFSKSATGLKRPSDPKLMNVSPDRIAVRTVNRGNTLKAAFQAFGIPEAKLNELAVLNGMNLADPLKPGVKLKVVG